MQKIERVVVCAAMKHGETIVCGARHFDSVMRTQLAAMNWWSVPNRSGSDWKQGFIDNYGVFMDRAEALAVARAAGQVDLRRPKGEPAHLLFSEDLY